MKGILCWTALLVPASVLAQDLPAAVADERGALESFLRRASVVSMEPIGVGITKPMKVTLRDGELTRHAVWKRVDDSRRGVHRGRDGGFQAGFKDSYKYEVAAYELDKMLELGLVPPTVERTLDGETGSLQLWIEGAFTEMSRREKNLLPEDETFWSNQLYKLRLLHQLIYNEDSNNVQNVIYDPKFRVYAIDNSRSFRRYHALPNASALRRFSRALLDRLEKLTLSELEVRLGVWLSRAEIEALVIRRDLILGHARRMVETLGEEAVLYP